MTTCKPTDLEPDRAWTTDLEPERSSNKTKYNIKTEKREKTLADTAKDVENDDPTGTNQKNECDILILTDLEPDQDEQSMHRMPTRDPN